MKKIIKHIIAPMEISLHAGAYGSHRELLWLMLMNTSGSVAEVGCGHYSTEMIDKICSQAGRRFRSYENNAEWSNKCPTQYGERIVTSNDKLDLDEELLFIDCAPGEARKEIIDKFKDKCSVIIVHDTEEGAEYVYGLSPVLSKFKYRLDYKPDHKPHTTAVSNTIDITKWVNQD